MYPNVETKLIQKPIIHPRRKKNGVCFIRINDFDNGEKLLNLTLGIRNFITKYEVFLRVSYMDDQSEWVPIYGTEALKCYKKQLTQFKAFSLHLGYFKEDLKTYIKVEVLEKSNKGYICLGEVQT